MKLKLSLYFTDEETERGQILCPRSYGSDRGQPEVPRELQDGTANPSWGGPEVLPEKVIPALSPAGQEGVTMRQSIPRRGIE